MTAPEKLRRLPYANQIITPITDNLTCKSKISISCDECGIVSTLSARGLYRRKSRQKYICFRCTNRIRNSSAEHRKKMREASKRKWKDEQYRAKMNAIQSSTNYKKRVGKITLNDLELPFRDQIVTPLTDDMTSKSKITVRCRCGTTSTIPVRSLYRLRERKRDEYRCPQCVKEMVRNISRSAEYREKMSLRSKKAWEDPKHKNRMAILRSKQPRISYQQELLYSYLDELRIQYYKEGETTRKGFYVFDCLIPKQLGLLKNLLVEVQGDYWHTLAKGMEKDRGKFTYVDRYFPDYEIMYIWEREFYSKDRVINRLKNKLGIHVDDLIDFKFKDVTIDVCDRSDNKIFLDLYHYLGPNRGGFIYGAYLDDKLIGVCQFSYPVRKEIATSRGLKCKEVLELSRFCIRPSYQKKNFASWFISRVTKKIIDSKSPKLLVAFSDTTMGHHGTIYKASNWTLDGEVKPDYWYVDKDGYVIHKKTLYERAVKMQIKERKYAEKNGYKKIWGGKKLRFVFKPYSPSSSRT